MFSLKTGEVLDVYPNNPVLKALTPKDSIANLKILPVKLTQDAILVDGSELKGSVFSRGGADSSLENNNVFYSEPRVYVEGTDPNDPMNSDGQAGPGVAANAATLVTSLLGVAALSVGGTAFFILNESYVGLGVFWAVGFAIVAYYAYTQVLSKEE